MDTDVQKPTVYLDIDGVLFGLVDGYFQCRPLVGSCVRWLVKHFNVKFLTGWGHNQLRDWMVTCYMSTSFAEIAYCKWHNSKLEVIKDATGEWYWLDDEPPVDTGIPPLDDFQLSTLDSHVIKVNQAGLWGHVHACHELALRAGVPNDWVDSVRMNRDVPYLGLWRNNRW